MSKKETSVPIKLDGEGITDLISLARNVEYDMLHSETQRAAIAYKIGQYYGWQGHLFEIKGLIEGLVLSFQDRFDSLGEMSLAKQLDFNGTTKEFFEAMSKSYDKPKKKKKAP